MKTYLSYSDLLVERFNWDGWEALIAQHGITIDRPHRSHHPDFREIIYPMNYGYVNDTLGTDGQEVDIFVGSVRNGLVGLLVTSDHRRGDREVKLLYGCTPEEIYLANGFINFDRRLLEGRLVLRRPMHTLWCG